MAKARVFRLRMAFSWRKVRFSRSMRLVVIWPGSISAASPWTTRLVTETASFPMLDQLRVTELGNGDLLRVARAPGTACTGLRHLDVPTVKQRHPVLIQTVAHKKRQTPDQDRGGASDQLAGAGLRAWGHHQREDQTLLGREGDPDPETPILARLAFCQPRKFFFLTNVHSSSSSTRSTRSCFTSASLTFSAWVAACWSQM